MKNISLLIILLVLGMSKTTFAQVGINTDGSSPHPSAMLDVSSSDKGFLPPRVSSLEDVQDPAPGLMVYLTPSNTMYYWNGSQWVAILNGEQTVYSVTVDVTSAELLDLHNAPKEVITAPGIGKFCNVLSVYAQTNVTDSFESTGDLMILYGDTGWPSKFTVDTDLAVFPESGPSMFIFAPYGSAALVVGLSVIPSLENIPIMLGAGEINPPEPGDPYNPDTSSSFEGGEATLRVKIIYTIESF